MKIDKTNEGILQSLVTTEEVVLALKNLELNVQETGTLVNEEGTNNEEEENNVGNTEETVQRKPYEWVHRKLDFASFGYDSDVEESGFPPWGNAVWEQETSGNKIYTNVPFNKLYYEYNEYKYDGGKPLNLFQNK